MKPVPVRNIPALFCLLLTFAIPAYAAGSADVPTAPNVTAEYEPTAQQMEEIKKQEYARSGVEKAASIRILRTFGDTYMYGKGVKQDYAEALYWYRSAAEQGDVESKNQLGLIFSDGGYGITRDQIKATKWFLEAAEQGNGNAQGNIALRYDSRSGVDQEHVEERGGIKPDDIKAVNWYRKAADQGLGIAQRNLGLHYELGLGIKKSAEEAYFWYSLMYNGGVAGHNAGAVDNAKSYMEKVSQSLTKAQIENAQDRVRAWKPVKDSTFTQH